MCENAETKTNKIVLPDELQKEILKFFMKTSIPRIAREKKQAKQNNDALSETKGQNTK